MSQLARLVVNAIALWVTVAVVPDLDWKDESNFVNILVLALVFGAINSYLKPVLKLLSLPVRLVTFGLFGLVLNAALFLLLAWVGEQFDLGFSIAGWPAEGFTLDVLVAAVIGAIVLSVVSTVPSFLVGRGRARCGPGRGGPPAYLYDLRRLRDDAQAVGSAFPDPWLRLYALKANGLPPLISELPGLGYGAGAVSGGALH